FLSVSAILGQVGCDPQVSGGSCPDPGDPEVHYVSRDPAECALIDFDCSPPQTLFSSECGCGCIGPEAPACPNPGETGVQYVSHDPRECELLDFACSPPERQFANECGCGCIGPETPACPDPR